MLVFIDESGDSGLSIANGASRYFTIALVVFEEDEEALACAQRIDLLRHELGWSPQSEFHFKRNSHTVRLDFLRAVSKYNFFYYGVVINKDPQKLWSEGFKDKRSFYKYVSGLVFENAKEKLFEARVTFDESGSLEFHRQLTTYLKRNFNEKNRKIISKVKMQSSQSTNLLQLADYMAGVINRSCMKKRNSDDYRKIVAHREINVQIWPKF